jgi:enoyl-CoA hydratase
VDDVLVEEIDTTTIITISRPRRRNALNHAAVEAIDAAVLAADARGARSIEITGADGNFCAGADLKELEDLEFTRRLRIMLDHLAEVPVPTIAAISGSCMGLGVQLAVACDIRFATPDARFAVPVAKLGLMVDHWTLQRVALTFGSGAARQMVLTAEVLTADDGFRLGFVQRLAGLDVALEVAARVAALAPLSLAGSKLGLNRVERHLDDADYTAAFERAWGSADLVEGRNAFTEGRSPQFRGV